ncbi:MAG: XdhC/CoxI family protein [Acidimicrobiales bacterium]
MNELFALLARCLREERPVAIATVIETVAAPESGSSTLPPVGAAILVSPDEGTHGTLGSAPLDQVVTEDIDAALAKGQGLTQHYGSAGEPGMNDVTVFIDVFAPPPRLIVVGAVDYSRALVRLGKLLGYRVTVCDARPMFATTQRFPEADEVVLSIPSEYLATVAARLGPLDAICVLTHDHTYDVPAIATALNTEVGYLGAMGSRSTHQQRVQLLLDAGVDSSRLHRLMAPIGINIGARTPEETAIAICAEIIALRSNVEVSSLRDQSGPIHRVQNP